MPRGSWGGIAARSTFACLRLRFRAMRPFLVLALLCAAAAAAKGPLDAHDSKEEANAAFAGVSKLLTQQQLKVSG